MAKDQDSVDEMLRDFRSINVASSRTGPQHVSPLRQIALPESQANQPEIVVVGIPEVAAPRSEPVRPPRDASPLVDTVPFQRNEIRADLSTNTCNSTASLSSTGSAATSSASGNVDMSKSVSTPAKNLADAKIADDVCGWWYSLANLANDRPIQEIARRIVTQFPHTAPTTLMFTSADPGLSTNRASARIATTIAQMTGQRVLMVDANWEANVDSLKRSEKVVAGITEVLAENRPWKELVLETQDGPLHVLPCGTSEVSLRKLSLETLRELNAQWQKDFAYVCINAGCVKQLISRRLAICCDATYVLVALNQTTKRDAQQAIKLLSENHARVVGAVVFDSPTQA